MTLKRKRMGCLLLAAVILVTAGAAGVHLSAGAAYSDTDSHWAGSVIARWEQMGVLQGMGADRFYPDTPITRAEFFAVVARIFAATQKADLSRFTDISPAAWYYHDVALAYQMGLLTGTSDYTLSPDSSITREEASVVLARALGLSTENTSALGRFSDSGSISEYARRNLAAMVGAGYIKGFPNHTFAPRKTLSRAEALTILGNIVTVIIDGSGAENRSYAGSVMITRPGVVLRGGSVEGDLILADGVGSGDVHLSNLHVRGRLIVRGGGPNSVNLSNVRVEGGVFVSNPSCTTRLNATASSELGIVTARTPTVYLGAGATAFVIPGDAARGNLYTLSANNFESLDVSGPAARIQLGSGQVDNVRFLPGAEGASLSLESGAKIGFVSVGAPGVAITGGGSLSRAEITQNGAVIDQRPAAYTIGDNLTARIGGVTASGRDTDFTQNNVVRTDSGMHAVRDAALVGGAGIEFSTVHTSVGAVISVTQKNAAVPLSRQYGRSAYWVGIHLPAPPLHTGDVAQVRADFDGSSGTQHTVPMTTVNNVTGLTVYVPVTRPGEALTGFWEQTVYIQWGQGTTETLHFSGGLALQALTAAQEQALVESYRSAAFGGYAAAYTGSEALRRLLLADNALGLELRGYDLFTPADQASIAVQLYGRRGGFASKQSIQDKLFSETIGRGALYAINRAMNAEQVKGIFEDATYAEQLVIESQTGSKYAMLSHWSRLLVARTVLLARGTDFTSEEQVAELFNGKTDELRTRETELITALNASRSRDDLQKLIENKINADLVGIIADGDPYKSLSAAEKAAVSAELFAMRPFASLDMVRTKFLELVGEPAALTPETDRNITGITADPTTVNLAVGDTMKVSLSINTASGSYKNNGAATWTVDKTDIASVTSTTGEVYGRAKGKAKITLVSIVDPKKKATVTVNVVDPVPATGLTLSKDRVEVGEGETAALTARLIPANSTDGITWSSDHPDIALFTDGRVQGLKPGKTVLTARTPAGFSASCDVWVTSKEPGVLLSRTSATVGIGSSVQLEALVSPITISNRAVKWATSDNRTATVDATGRVTGVAEGTVTITASSLAYPELSASCAVRVDGNVRGVSLGVSSLTLYKNGVYTFAPKVVPTGDPDTEIDWNVMSGGKRVINVTEKGVVQGLAAGTAQVIASLKDDPAVFAVCDVEVLSTTLKFSINAKSATLNVGENLMLVGTFNPAGVMNKTIDFRSANADIASVDASGKITAVAAGKVRIYAVPQADQSLEQFVDVTVKEIALKKISFANTAVTTYRRGQFDLIPIFDPPNATAAFQPVRWETEDDALVNVENGHVVGNRTTWWTERTPVYGPDPVSGKNVILSYEDKLVDHPVRIKAIAADGKFAECKVSVRDEDGADIVDSIEILLDKWVFLTGAKQNVNVAFNAKDKDKLPPDMKTTWENPDPDIAYVGKDNYLIAVGADDLRGLPGRAQIIATSADAGKSDNKYVIVANEGVSRISLDGLTSTTRYGGFLEMSTTAAGKTKNVKATPTTQGNADKRLVWEAFEPEYDAQGKPLNSPQTENGLVRKSSVVDVAFDENTGAATLAAKAPGWARVVVQPYQQYKYAAAKPSEMDADELRESLIEFVVDDLGGTPNSRLGPDKYVYYGPYRTWAVVATTPGQNPGDPEILEYDWVRVALDPDMAMPAVVKNKVTNDTNEFWVYVAPPAQIDSAAFVAETQRVDVGKRVTFTVDMMPDTAVAYGVEWSFNETVAREISRELLPGKASITLEGLMTGTTAVEFVAGGDIFGPDGQRAYLGKEPVSLKGALHVGYVETSGVTIAPAGPQTLFLNGTLKLGADVAPLDASYRELAWTSSNGGVATVDENGLVTAVGTGAAVITATTTDPDLAKRKSASITIIVRTYDSVESVALAGTLSMPNLWETKTLTADIMPASAVHEGLDIRWEAGGDVDALQIVSGQGTSAVTLIGVANGTVQLTVTVGGIVSNQCEVTVGTGISTVFGTLTVPVGAMSFSLAGFSAAVDEDSPEPPVFESLDTGVAGVSSEGVVTGKKAGKTELRVRQGKSTRTFSVLVVADAAAPPALIKVELRAFAGVAVGNVLRLTAHLTPVNADRSGLVWSSSNSAVASVSDGVVTGVKAGKATITVRDASGKLKDTCTVTVVAADKKPVSSLDLNKKTLDLKAGASSTLSVSYLPKSPTIKGVTWSSSNENVARVDSKGKVTGVSSGSCVITATSDSGGKTASCAVNVTVPVKSISLSETGKTLGVGQSFRLVPLLNPSDCTNKNVTWKSSAPAVATVAPDGTVTAHKSGKATITVMSTDGKKTATCKITVTK